ncbi:MAG: hypothetical protein KDA52_24175, partial [Planctomycetaceae bacterium]|nr:hypothetical protein [Planctomycetaceae bacterium]
MHQSRPTSEAAARVLDLTAKLAHVTREPASEPHLLAALWLDESVARDLLEQSGITETLVRQWLGNDVLFHPVDDELTHETGAAATHLPNLTSVITAAQSFAGQLGRHAEMGTEHL